MEVSPMDSGAESLAEAQEQPITPSGTIDQLGSKPLQNPIQRAIDRQSNGFIQKYQESDANRIYNTGGIGNAFDGNSTIDSASPLIIANRPLASLSSSSRRAGLGLRKRLAAHNAEFISRGDSVGEFIPVSIKRKYKPLSQSDVAGKVSSTLEPAMEVSPMDSGAESLADSQGRSITLAAKTKPLFQIPIQRQFQNIVFRKNNYEHGITNNHVNARNVLTAGANLITSSAENIAFSPSQPSSISHAKLFQGKQVINDALRFPLVKPVNIQRKSSVNEEQLDSESTMAGYLQRQITSSDGGGTATLTTSNQTVGIEGTQTGKSVANTLSADDIVDKVWRKFMRKLVSEQERMGGSRRWAS